MSTSPQYASTPRQETVGISTANTNRDGSGSITTLFTPGADGSIIDSIQVKAVGTTTAGMVRLFKKLNSGTWQLIEEFIVAPIVPSAAIATFSNSRVYSEFVFVVPSGVTLGVSTHNAETFEITVFGGDF